jgi:hypothetical protein
LITSSSPVVAELELSFVSLAGAASAVLTSRSARAGPYAVPLPAPVPFFIVGAVRCREEPVDWATPATAKTHIAATSGART